MSLLPWMTLVFLLSAGTGSDAVDVNRLTNTVKRIRQYGIQGQYCLAANIPLHDNDLNLPSKESVLNELNTDQVFADDTLVAAKVSPPEHAELRVMTNLDTLIPNSNGKFLLIYSYLSPCGKKCINRDSRFNILRAIRNTVLTNWKDVAFVFEVVFDTPKDQNNLGSLPTVIPKERLIEILTELGNSGIGLKNIFRCYRANSEFQCHSCSNRGQVSNVCVDNKAVPGQEEGTDVGRGRSGSRGRRRDRCRGVSRDRRRSGSRDRRRGVSRDRRRSVSRDRRRGVSRDRRRSVSRDRRRGVSRDRRRGVSRDRRRSGSRDRHRSGGRG